MIDQFSQQYLGIAGSIKMMTVPGFTKIFQSWNTAEPYLTEKGIYTQWTSPSKHGGNIQITEQTMQQLHQ